MIGKPIENVLINIPIKSNLIEISIKNKHLDDGSKLQEHS